MIYPKEDFTPATYTILNFPVMTSTRWSSTCGTKA